MKRRNFLKTTALSAVAFSASGFIRFDGDRYVGDCATTSDILGPFYRPNSPVRTNLRIGGAAGGPAILSGMVRHDDCTTSYKGARVELWHCDAGGVYDNQSPEFRYRGTAITNEKGFYTFQTIMPVSYGGVGFIRPAHYHLMITAEGYQPLVTQLYFSGDPHIKGDAYAASPNSQKRILKVTKDGKGVILVNYNVGMSKILRLEAASIGKLTGTYVSQQDTTKTVELFVYDNRLWKKNEAFGNKFEYMGNKTFEEAGNPDAFSWKLQFKLLSSGAIVLTERLVDGDSATKEFLYLKNQT